MEKTNNKLHVKSKFKLDLKNLDNIKSEGDEINFEEPDINKDEKLKLGLNSNLMLFKKYFS